MHLLDTEKIRSEAGLYMQNEPFKFDGPGGCSTKFLSKSRKLRAQAQVNFHLADS